MLKNKIVKFFLIFIVKNIMVKYAFSLVKKIAVQNFTRQQPNPNPNFNPFGWILYVQLGKIYCKKIPKKCC